MDPARDNAGEGKKFRPYRNRLIAVAIALIIVIAGFTLYYTSTNKPPGPNTLIIYTYSSFLGSGANRTQAMNVVFGTFEKEYNVSITVENLTAPLLQTLEAQKSNPQADIVIGLDNINSLQAVSDGLLVKYVPPAQNYINKTLLSEMGNASAYVTPYEHGYLGLDYNKSFFGGKNLTPSFSNISSNSSIAKNLLIENPMTDETGTEFLLWEIAYYKYMLHENWTLWWSSMKPYLTGHTYSGWTSAFYNFETGPGTNLVVSYLTDPAYFHWSGTYNASASTVTFNNGTAYGWDSVYGIGIVNGSGKLALDREFVNYFLSPTVQNELPLNEWMYPANSTISPPPLFNYVQNQSLIHPLNLYMGPATISANLLNWETEWQITMS